MTPRRLGALAALTAAALALTACGAPSATPATTSNGPTQTVQVTDNNGTHSIQVPPTSVVALDNRTFETLHAWNVKLSAAPRQLVPPTIGYRDDASIPDIGTHIEPNLELIVAAQPTVIINGNRFVRHFDTIGKLAPNAAQLSFEPREGEPLDAELKRATTELGKVFDKQAEAEALTKALDDSIAAVKHAYVPGQKVMAVTVSGGKIGYLAPKVGRTLGPTFELFGFTPALVVEGASDDHQGDDISVEAIAQSNPDWILVMDRDAAVAGNNPNTKPAATVIEQSEALKNVTAVQKGQVVIMPPDSYTNEGIQTYTDYFEQLAQAMAAAT